MKYSENQIRTAFAIAEIPTDFANKIIGYLPQAVEQLRLTEPETIADLFEWFCLTENICETELKSSKRDRYLFEIRLKFTTLAKEKFGKRATQQAIGNILNRNHCTVLHYFKTIKARKLKVDKLNRIKNGE